MIHPLRKVTWCEDWQVFLVQWWIMFNDISRAVYGLSILSRAWQISNLQYGKKTFDIRLLQSYIISHFRVSRLVIESCKVQSWSQPRIWSPAWLHEVKSFLINFHALVALQELDLVEAEHLLNDHCVGVDSGRQGSVASTSWWGGPWFLIQCNNKALYWIRQNQYLGSCKSVSRVLARKIDDS